MHPDITQLLMAARGHQGLPMQIGAPPPGGGIPAGPPAPPQGGDSDQAVASSAAQHLLEATSQAHDPALKVAFATALAALHKYLANSEKEHQDALAGKFSPRLMAQAHGRG